MQQRDAAARLHASQTLYISDLWRPCQLAELMSCLVNLAQQSSQEHLVQPCYCRRASPCLSYWNTYHTFRQEGATHVHKQVVDWQQAWIQQMHKQQPAVLGLEAACRIWCLIFCFMLISKKFTFSVTYVVSQLYMYNVMARSASYWTVHRCGDSKGPKQHLTTED